MKWLKEEITFSRKEFLGISALMSIGLIMLVFQYAPKGKEREYDIRIDDILLEETNVVNESVPYKVPRQKQKFNKKSSPKIEAKKAELKPKTFERFSFNPNSIGKDSLVRLGFKKRVADTWVKFRLKGKKYNNTSDVLSIYGIDSNLVFNIQELFIFPQVKASSGTFAEAKKITKNKFVKPTKIVDLNSCTEKDLKELGGIGQIFATRILKYRELLGGFARKKQLLQVYGLTDSTYQVIKEFVDISTPPKKINVNTASKKQLSDHFLVDYKSAKLIYAYRKEHGPFIDSIDFQSIKGIPEPKKLEIMPYLSFAL